MNYCKKRGHEMTGYNVMVNKTTGERRCRACFNYRQQERRANKQPEKRSEPSIVKVPVSGWGYAARQEA